MIETTCAACDRELDGDAIQVTTDGRILAVCCEDCGHGLCEAEDRA